MDYGDFKDLTWRAASDKVWHDKAFNIAKNPKFDEYQRGLASNTGFFFLLCVIDIFRKYAWVIPFKDRKGITITVFQKILNESKCKPNKIWVDKGSKFYNRWMKSWLDKNDIEMYSFNT